MLKRLSLTQTPLGIPQTILEVSKYFKYNIFSNLKGIATCPNFSTDRFNVSIDNDQREFYLQSSMDSFNQYWLNDKPLESFSNVLDTSEIPEDNAYCLFLIYNTTLKKLKMSGNDCSDKKMVLCRKVSTWTPNCSANHTFQKLNTFDFMLDPGVNFINI